MGTEEKTFTIAAAATTSDIFAIGAFESGSLQLAAAFTGASVAVHASNDGTNFTEVLELSPETNPITHANNAAVMIPANTFRFKFMRLVSASAEAAAREIVAFFKRR